MSLTWIPLNQGARFNYESAKTARDEQIVSGPLGGTIIRKAALSAGEGPYLIVPIAIVDMDGVLVIGPPGKSQ